MLDVHILVSNDTRKDWETQSLASVRDAISRADYPINKLRRESPQEAAKLMKEFR